MPTFFIDSASIGNLVVTGSLSTTGSLIISGGFSFNSILTASLLGTASTATNVGNATASYALGSNVFGPLGAGSILSSSFTLTSSFTTTSSYSFVNRKHTDTLFQALGCRTVGTPIDINIFSGQGNAGFTIPSRSVILSAVYVDRPAIINGLYFRVTNIGTWTAQNYNGIGLYSYSNGTLSLVASSSNSDNIFRGSDIIKSGSFLTAYSASAGVYYTAILFDRVYVSGISITFASYGLQQRVYDFTNSAFLTGMAKEYTTLPTSIAASLFTSVADETNTSGNPFVYLSGSYT